MYCLFNGEKVWSNNLVYKEKFGNNLKSNYLPPTNQNRPKMAILVNPGLMFVNIKLLNSTFCMKTSAECR